MTLLTPEEIVKASCGEVGGLVLAPENIAAGLDAVARAQLRKVIEEILSIREDFPDDSDDFMRNVLLLVEMARKEIE